MDAFAEWLRSGTPPHYVWLLFGGLALFEDWIARSRFAPNSTVQLAFKLLHLALGRVPGIGAVIAVLGNVKPQPKITIEPVESPGNNVPPTALIFLCLFPLSVGCVNLEQTLQKSITSAARTGSSCYNILNSLDAEKQDAIRARAKGGGLMVPDPDGAQADFAAWKELRGKVKNACDAVLVASFEADAMTPLILAARDKETQVTSWVAKVARLIGETAAALKSVGVALPGGF